MSGAVLVAVAAAMGNLLQGWDNATIAGVLFLYSRNSKFELPMHQRGDAVSSMVYEANARVRDPVYGCVGAISSLQQQIDLLQTQLALAQAEVVHMRMRHFSLSMSSASTDSPDNNNSPPPPPSSKLMSSSHQTKSLFNMDAMVVDHPNMGESLWSC
ncbi:hypothetical protein TEA_019740 [Camellia sinensis var. sinensis]|uniref:LOB domain-containing protein n=1 Tax=Camellia sinensis var. sinensis TaxID=542762 RepID=A0A4S4EU80_CAMSN|nr:hypothetical protein TEA_019740 [Camellia sinensis var. sinensis]